MASARERAERAEALLQRARKLAEGALCDLDSASAGGQSYARAAEAQLRELGALLDGWAIANGLDAEG